ncbi:MAG: tryptophan synthase subunit alpha [Victivallaceae bacterium]|nr:tryptophan synthase subunit alpha [Victivallaceae bacterium]
MNRISNTFAKCRSENRNALVVYVTMGCPDLENSERLVTELISAGADIIELGVPFSDPMADGPVIQESARRALAAGTTLQGVLDRTKNIRRRYPDTPLILFSYYNVILAYGIEKLAAAAAAAGIDGLLVVDLAFEHRQELLPALNKHRLSLIPLVAPTTPPERAAQIVRDATGFVYCITSKGVTGGGAAFDPELEKRLAELRQSCPVPLAAGFGIDSAEKVRYLTRFTDGIVVGSAVMRRINAGADIEQGIRAASKLTAEIAKILKAD